MNIINGKYQITTTPEEFSQSVKRIQRVADNFTKVERNRERKLKWPATSLSEAIETLGAKIQETISSARFNHGK